MTKKKQIIIYTLCGIICLEFWLRHHYGFCDALLYRSSSSYEYIPQPNQDRHRFGAHIHYNSYSQRSEEPDSTKIRILGLGDSVLFGGTMIDQDSIATTLFSKQTGMQMLNIAAGSWGPDNCAAYLEENGTFGAKAMILVCSSHDAYDVMSHIPVVGIYPNYPDKQYGCAIWELTDRYLMPRIRHYFHTHRLSSDPDEKVVEQAQGEQVEKKGITFNPGFDSLKKIAEQKHIPFCIYLHPELSELEQGKFNSMGQEILEWTEENGIYTVNGLTEEMEPDMYRDIIHLNEKGQRKLAETLKKIVTNLQIDPS